MQFCLQLYNINIIDAPQAAYLNIQVDDHPNLFGQITSDYAHKGMQALLSEWGKWTTTIYFCFQFQGRKLIFNRVDFFTKGGGILPNNSYKPSPANIERFTAKENHIGSVVSKILNRQTSCYSYKTIFLKLICDAMKVRLRYRRERGDIW